jgi:threonine/homoserine/homoserine lactone efflux protein
VITHFLAFLGVSAVVIVTPGQDTALTIRNTLRGGRRNGGLQTLVPALRSRESEPKASPRGRPLRQGFVSNLGNPKMAIFFTSLLPQFATRPAFGALLFLGLVFCVITLAWLTAYAFAVAKAGDFLRRARIRRTVDGLTGAVLVGLGLRLAAEQH